MGWNDTSQLLANYDEFFSARRYGSYDLSGNTFCIIAIVFAATV